MPRYNVYTSIRGVSLEGEAVEREFMITGVEAHSTGGAEHKLLDAGIPFITNALAFESTDTGEYFCTLLPRCRVYDVRDFLTRCRALFNHRRGIVSVYREAIAEMTEQKNQLEAEIKAKALQLESLRADISEAYEGLNDILQKWGASPLDHSYDETPAGIA